MIYGIDDIILAEMWSQILMSDPKNLRQWLLWKFSDFYKSLSAVLKFTPDIIISIFQNLADVLWVIMG